MKFFKTYKKYIKVSAVIWIVCLVAFAICYFLLVNPQNEAKKDIEQKLLQGKQEYKRAQMAARPEFHALIHEEIGTLKETMGSFVLDYKSAEDLTFDISKIANECSLNSFSVKSNDTEMVSESSDPNSIIEKRMKVSFIGEFPEFALFLNKLERHKPVLFIHEFVLSRQNGSDKNYQVTVELAALISKQSAEKQEREVESIISFND